MTDAFAYQAARADGSIERGVVELSDRSDAIASLRGRGLLALELKPMSSAVATRSRLSANDLAIGLRTLATLVGSGMPLSRALAAFQDVAPPAWAAGVAQIRDRVREGDSLGSALERSTLGIPRLLTGVIRAGEAGSGLASAVSRAADISESSARLRASIRSALAYPILLASVGTASIAIIIVVVLPRFASIIADVGGAVPPLARGILGAASFARAVTLSFLLAVIAVLVLWRTWMSSPVARVRLHAVLLGLPVVGALRLATSSSRACSALAALLDAGVPVAAGLHHASRATGDAEIERRLRAARDQVVGGARLSAALSNERAVTATARRLIRAGEDSGRLSEMLSRSAEIDATRVADSLRSMVRLLEPALIIGFAGVIAIVSGALLQTVYSIRP